MRRHASIVVLLVFFLNLANCSPNHPDLISKDVQTTPDTSTTKYKLVWEDEFDQQTLDEINNWNIEVNGDGGGNNELQYYKRDNIELGIEPSTGKKCLIISAKKEQYQGKSCTSGRVTTNGKRSFRYGKIEANIKFPITENGLWPAFWMLGSDYTTVGWPRCGEIDIVEMGNATGINQGTQSRYFSGWFHWGESWNNGSYPNSGGVFTSNASLQDSFHLFTLIWDEQSIKAYLDLDKYPNASPYAQLLLTGADIQGNPAHYFKKGFFIILNLAIGGNFTQIWDINKITALNQENNYTSKMYVDYVRVYQK